jgi:hypothetical protein
MLRQIFPLMLSLFLFGWLQSATAGGNTPDTEKKCYDVICEEGCAKCIVLGEGEITIVKPGCADVYEKPCPNTPGSYTDHTPDVWVSDGVDSFGFTGGEAYFNDATQKADLTVYYSSVEYTNYNSWLIGAGLN